MSSNHGPAPPCLSYVVSDAVVPCGTVYGRWSFWQCVYAYQRSALNFLVKNHDQIRASMFKERNPRTWGLQCTVSRY
jgi:hypothetical protein